MRPLRRAIKEEHKQERREAILAAAVSLFEDRSYDAITMAQIAAAAGLAKGTVYLYFHAKEEVFLALLDAHLDAWFLAMDGPLGDPARRWTPGSVAKLAAETLTEDRALRRLMAIVGGILEHNVDYATALGFKERLALRARGGGATLESIFDFVAPGEGTALLLRLYGLAIGLQQLAEPAPVMREVLREPHLEEFRIDFRSEFENSVTLMLEGYRQLFQPITDKAKPAFEPL